MRGSTTLNSAFGSSHRWAGALLLTEQISLAACACRVSLFSLSFSSLIHSAPFHSIRTLIPPPLLLSSAPIFVLRVRNQELSKAIEDIRSEAARTGSAPTSESLASLTATQALQEARDQVALLTARIREVEAQMAAQAAEFGRERTALQQTLDDASGNLARERIRVAEAVRTGCAREPLSHGVSLGGCQTWSSLLRLFPCVVAALSRGDLCSLPKRR